MTRTEEKKRQLESAMAQYGKEDICLAFSGGVDSSLLLKAASDAARENGTKVYAVTFDSRLHPSCDLEIASRVAKELGGIHEVITVDELEQEEIRHNPVNRCYLCKRHLFSRLAELADGYMDAAVRLRMGLEEVRAELETAEDGRRRALEGRAKLLRQMLKEMRDLRQLAEGYYTRPRDGTYTMSQIYAPRVDSTKQ